MVCLAGLFLAAGCGGGGGGGAVPNITVPGVGGGGGASTSGTVAPLPTNAQATLNPAGIGFGDVAVGSSASLAVTLTNTGNRDLQLTTVNVTGRSFSFTDLTLPQALAPSQKVTFLVHFSPQTTGLNSGTMSFLSNAINSPTVLTLSGTGIAALAGNLVANPVDINFGTVAVGNTLSQSVTITNTGNSAITVAQANLTGSAFNVVGLAVPLGLPAGQSHTFTVQFAPQASGSVAGSLSLVSDAPNSPTTISFTGTGLDQVVQLSASPTTVGFGDIFVGQSATQTVTLRNTGNTSVSISSVTVNGPGFSVSGITPPLLLSPGQERNLTVTFAPATAGAASGSVVVLSTATNSPTTIGLSGNGITQVRTLGVSPASLDFGEVVVGSTQTLSTSVTNTGNVNVTISAANVSGTGFSVSGFSLPVTLAPGQSASLSVAFAPQAAASVTGSVSLVSDASNSPISVALTATGIEQPVGRLTSDQGVLISGVNFGDVVVNTTSALQITLTNTGNASLNVTQAAVTGAGFSLVEITQPSRDPESSTVTSGNIFGVTVTPPVALAPGDTITFNIQFSPAQTGTATGNLEVTHDGANSPVNIPLSGNATPVPVGQLSSSPISINFGNVVIATTASRTVTLTNTGTAAVNVTSATPSGAGFAVAGFTAGTLQPGETSSFNVQFTPAGAGAVTGNVVVASDAANAPTQIDLAGEGVTAPIGRLAIAPERIDFGSLIVGATASESVVLTNTGNAALNVSSVTLPGAPYTVTGLPATFTLQPGQSLAAFTVQFAPATAGSFPASLTFTSDGSNSPTALPLEGSGLNQSLQLSANPVSIDFGEVTVGTTAQQTLTITNTGNVNVTITSVTSSNSGFSVDNFSGTLTPGQGTSVVARFTPASVGAVPAGTITISSNAPDVTVSLNGTGTAALLPVVSLSPSAVDFGAVIIGNVVTQTVRINNTGNAALTITDVQHTDSGFSILTPPDKTTVAPGDFAQFTVQFAPQAPAGAKASTVTIVSNVPDVVLNLTGTAVAPTRVLGASPGTISFGDVTQNTTASQSVTLANSGNSSVTISSFSAPAGFAVTGLSNGQVIAAGGQAAFTVQFTPTSVSAFNGNVQIVSNADNTPANIAVSGNGVAPPAPVVTLSPSALDFGEVIIGNVVTQNVTITNTGNATLTGITVTHTDSGFSIAAQPAQTSLAPGASTTFTVQFAPQSPAGAKSGSATVSSNAPDQSITLNATAVAATRTLAASPGTIDFGNVTQNTTAAQSVTLTNSGNSSITISSFSAPAGFAVTGLSNGQVIAAGGEASFTIEFTPASVAAFGGNVQIVSNADNAPTNIAVSGTGTAPLVPVVTLNPSAVDFGEVIIGAVVTQDVTITNTGNATLSGITVTHTDSGFSISAQPGQNSLAPGASTTFTVQFAPQAPAGARASTVTVSSNVADVTLGLTGTAAAVTRVLNASPGTINFGDVTQNTTASQSVTLTNSGNSSITLGAVSAPTGFAVTGLSNGQVIAAGGQATFTVEFTPTSATAFNGNVSIASDADNQPTTVTVSGTGTAPPAPAVSLSPSPLGFGSVVIGASSTQTVTISNTGNATLNLGTVTSNDANFVVASQPVSTSVAAGSSTTFTVRFEPQAPGGAKAATISVPSNAPTANLPASGTAVTQNLALSANPSSVDFGQVVTGNLVSQTVTLTNTGNIALTIGTVTASAGFSIAGQPALTSLNPGQSTTVTAQFQPGSTGVVNGSLTIPIASSTANSQTTVNLTGEGVAAANLVATPGSINFGDIIVGGNSILSVTLTNTGGVDVNITAVSVTGAQASQFGHNLTNQAVGANGGTAAFNVTFTPTGGAAAGNIQITHDGPNSPLNIALSGNGLAQTRLLAANPNSVGFGSLTQGAPAVDQTIVLSNSGNSAVTLGTPVIPNALYSILQSLNGQVVNPGGTFAFTLRFQPNTVGNHDTTIQIPSNATDSPANIAVSAEVTPAPAPAISLSPASLSFGSVIIGSTQTQTVTITNTGNATLNLGTVTSNDANFTIFSQPASTTVAAGSSTTFQVRFAPQAPAGAKSGTVTVPNTNGVPNGSLSVSGTAVDQTRIIGANPTSINFGNVTRNTTATQNVTLSNTGNTTLTISTVVPTPGVYTITGPSPNGQSIPPGGSLQFTVQFLPDADTSFPGNVAVNSNATNTATLNISLNGTGTPPPAPIITLSPTSLSFGSVIIGSTQTQTVTITNTGNATLNLGTVTSNDANFTIFSQPASTTVAAGSSTTFQVRFAPQAPAGAKSGTVTVPNTNGVPNGSLSVSGTAVDQTRIIGANPTSINFGNVTRNTTATQNVTLSNTGNTTLTISTVVPTPGVYTITGPSPNGQSIPPGGNLQFTVQFLPDADTSFPGNVAVNSNATNTATLNISLNGTGTPPPAPIITLSPTSLSFGSVIIGSTQTQTVTINNTGNATLNLGTVTSNDANFVVTQPVSTTVAAGSSTTFTVQFLPQAPAGAKSGTVTVPNTNGVPNGSLSVSGTAVDQTRIIGANPTSINFGNVTRNTTATQNVTLSNTGNTTLTISTVVPTPGVYTITGPSPNGQSIPPGGSLQFTVQFLPDADTSFPGNVAVNSNATNTATLNISLNGTGTPPPAPITSLSPASLDFGSVIVGNAVTQSVTVTNTGNATMTSLAASVANTGFSISSPPALTSLSPGQSTSFSVRFQPVGAGTVTRTVSVTSNAPTVTMSVTGNGVAQVRTLSLLPTTMNFGQVTTNTSSSLNATLRNTGNFTVQVSSVAITGSGFFTITAGNTGAFALAAGAEVTYTIRFLPTGTGVANGTLTVSSDATNPPHTIALTGEGTPPPIGTVSPSPTSISFGTVLVGNSATQNVTVTNTGNASLTISSITPPNANFVIENFAPNTSLAPGANTVFTVRFAPQGAGATSGNVTISSNASNPSATVSVSGTGEAVVRAFSATPGSLSFGNVVVGSSSTLGVTLTNTGNVNVTISAAAASGAGFSVQGFTGATLVPGGTLSFSVRFAPASGGSVSGSVTFTTDAPAPPSVALSGTGTIGTLSSSSTNVGFGDVVVNNTSSQSVTLTNTGSATLQITGVSSSSARFTASIQGAPLPRNLNPGATATLNISFTPNAIASFSGTITVTSTTSSNPSLAINVSGNGIAAPIGHLTATPSSHNFGSVIVGTTAGVSVQLSNTGNASLTISSATPSGSGIGFTGLSLPLTIAAGSSSSFTAQFAPSSAGSVSGSITLGSNADNPSLVISLSGTGVAQVRTLDASPSSINFGDVQVNNSSSANITLTNTGNVTLNISSVAVSGAGFSITAGPAAPFPLGAGLNVQFTVRFAPTSTGAASGNFTVTSDATITTNTVSLSGNGSSAAAGQLSLSLVNIDFGGVAVGGSVEVSNTITNTGNASVTISQINSNNSAFTFTGVTLPLVIPAGQQAFFNLRFTASAVGTTSGTISFTSDAANSPTIAVSGTGVQGVVVAWDASTSPDVVGYNVYRAETSGGPYAKVTGSLVTGTTFQDSTVQNGKTYFYVARAVDPDGIESVNSNEVSKVIPP